MMSLLRHNNIVMGSSAWRDVSQGDWKAGSDCANVTCCGRLFQTRAAATGKVRSPAVDNRVQWMTTRRNVVDIVPRNPPAHEVHQQDTNVPLLANTCRQGEQACSQSSPPPLTNEVREEAEWWGRTLTIRKPAGQQSLLPTGDAWAGTAEYRQGLHFHNPVVTNKWRYQRLENGSGDGSANAS